MRGKKQGESLRLGQLCVPLSLVINVLVSPTVAFVGANSSSDTKTDEGTSTSYDDVDQGLFLWALDKTCPKEHWGQENSHETHSLLFCAAAPSPARIRLVLLTPDQGCRRAPQTISTERERERREIALGRLPGTQYTAFCHTIYSIGWKCVTRAEGRNRQIWDQH